MLKHTEHPPACSWLIADSGIPMGKGKALREERGFDGRSAAWTKTKPPLPKLEPPKQNTGWCRAGNGRDDRGRSVPLRLRDTRNRSLCSLACHRGTAKAVFGGPSEGAAGRSGSCHPGSSARGAADYLAADPAHSQLRVAEMGKRKVPRSQPAFLTSFWAVFQDTREGCTCIALPKSSMINVLTRDKRQADKAGG